MIIDGVEYIKKSESHMAQNTEGLEYCMVRTYSGRVFTGFLKTFKDRFAIVLNARRIWYWEGAASLSELAVEGTTKPEQCKFPTEVPEVRLTEVVEVIPMTEKARRSIADVPVWSAKDE